MRQRFGIMVVLVFAAALVGCDGGGAEPNAPAAPSPPPPSTPEPEPVLNPERHEWSLAEAVSKLSDRADGLSAAVRLIRLAGVAPTVVPDPLGRDEAQALRLAPLGGDMVAVGIWQVGRRDRLWGPVLIDVAGGVTLVGEELGDADPVLLRISPDADLYPHLVIAGDRVVIATEPESSAIRLQGGDRVRFVLGDDEDFPEVQLVLRDAPDVVVARYRWDPYELVFMGPASDRIPGAHGGGKFTLDLEQCGALVPIGGIIPEFEEPAEPNALPPTDALDLGAPV